MDFLSKISERYSNSLFTNEEVVEMYHSVEHRRQYSRNQEWIIWQASSASKNYVAFFNVSKKTLQLPEDKWSELIDTKIVRDLWKKEDIQLSGQKIASHGVLLVAY